MLMDADGCSTRLRMLMDADWLRSGAIYAVRKTPSWAGVTWQMLRCRRSKATASHRKKKKKGGAPVHKAAVALKEPESRLRLCRLVSRAAASPLGVVLMLSWH
jgi:hypothetical protein